MAIHCNVEHMLQHAWTSSFFYIFLQEFPLKKRSKSMPFARPFGARWPRPMPSAAGVFARVDARRRAAVPLGWLTLRHIPKELILF